MQLLGAFVVHENVWIRVKDLRSLMLNPLTSRPFAQHPNIVSLMGIHAEQGVFSLLQVRLNEIFVIVFCHFVFDS